MCLGCMIRNKNGKENKSNSQYHLAVFLYMCSGGFCVLSHIEQ